MKELIIKAGDTIIDAMAGLLIVLILLCSCFVFMDNPLASFLILIFGFLFVIITFYFIYLLIDIKDTLHNIEENTRKEEQ